ncbi:acetyl-CoA carboxylase carboxyl transferase subunit beta [bacterium]|nr:MAG: acetyl-CoA carboxylase carboxyl transferase subunit beta [bacterium]RKZ21694.1 MAG: acetyl-CoA carboxylase carboxyl transferase subunit beta [bacterium]RKZ24708.1 MAG: acetyl-CoA carboxylase carboxyl transferase subunit beta [bacterium]
MRWFVRKEKGIKSKEKKPIPDGVWVKCDSCGEILYRKELEKNLWVCPRCSYHFRISHKKYLEMLLDEGTFKEKDGNLAPVDFLKFKDYPKKIEKSMKNTGLKDAIICGEGKIEGMDVEICVMDFKFIGGSMGSVVGEKVKRAIYRAKERKVPLIIVNASGGARMQEGILSLMQMAKTASALNLLAEEKVPYISILTNPTTAGVMASYASLGDAVIAEPGALLGFAGPRVIQQTIKQELPPGFQRSEFMLKHGMIDMIVERKNLKKTVVTLLRHFLNK